MGNIVTDGSTAGWLPDAKIADPDRTLDHPEWQISHDDFNDLTSAADVIASHLCGEPDGSGAWFLGGYAQTADPLTATLAGLGTGRWHMWPDSTDDAWKFRESGETAERMLFDDQGIGVLKLDSYAGVTLAPAGKLWLRSNAGTLQTSYDGGAWTGLAGGGGIADSDNVTWTGTHSFEGASFNVNPLATFAAGISMATTTTLAAGANTLISGDKLQVGQLSGAVTAALGGTGQAGGYAVGDMLYASGASALSKLAAVAVGQVMISGGVTTAPSWSASPLVTDITVGGSGSSARIGAWATDTKIVQIGGTSATASYRGLTGVSGAGTDKVGGDLRLVGGISTGAAAGGDVEIWHPLRTTPSDAVENTAVMTWEFTAPTDVGDGTGVAHSDLLPGVGANGATTGNNIGSTSKRVRSIWLDEYIYANRFGSADDTNSYWEFDESDGASITLGGTSRNKVGAAFSRFALNGGVYKDSSAFEVIVGGAGADGRGRFENNISSTGVSGIISTNDNSWSGTMLVDGSGTTRTGVAGNTYFVGLTSQAHFGALTNTDSHWISGTADSTADRVASAVYNAGNRYLRVGYFMELSEMSAPSAGAANTARIFAVDSGGGKTVLKVIFASGAAQTIATEP